MPSTPASLRIAAFGFRSLPPSEGGAGADKFALELLPRLAARGHSVIAYNRVYPGKPKPEGDVEFRGVKVRSFRTVAKAGFDSLLHSFKVAFDIIWNNTADVVHIQNGGNSLVAPLLRLFGKRTYVSQDGLDWKRDKWSWYAKLYLRLMSQFTGRVHNQIIFDNVFARQYFEGRFKRSYEFVPFGADVNYTGEGDAVLGRLGLTPGDYLLFVGRFIPDKGLQYLIPAFERSTLEKKLVLVGGSPNPSAFEAGLRQTRDPRILFPGYIYGAETHALMRNCFAYIQPSDVEGLSPVILESSFLGAPVICSDIEQNQYILGDTGLYFQKGDAVDAQRVLEEAVAEPEKLKARAAAQRERIVAQYSWDKVVDDHVSIFRES